MSSSRSRSPLLLLALTIPFVSISNSVNVCRDGVKCSPADLLCCSHSPVRHAIMSLPDWSQLFAKSLSLSPDLWHKFNTTTHDRNDTIWSLQEIEAGRSQVLNDVNRRCHLHTCHDQFVTTLFPTHVITTSVPTPPSPLDFAALVTIIVACTACALALIVFIIVLACICRRRKKRRSCEILRETSSSTAASPNGVVVNGNPSRDSPRSENNSHRQLILNEYDVCDNTPLPTPSHVTANHGPAHFDVIAASSSLHVVIATCEPQPAEVATESECSRL